MNPTKTLCLCALLALAPSRGAAQDMKELVRLASDYARATTPAEREVLREELKAFEDVPVRELWQALGKGLVRGAKSASEALRPDELEDSLTLTDGFAFEAGGRRWTYAVGLPARYDPSQRYALVLDPGHGLMRSREQRLQHGQTGIWLGALQGQDVIFVRTNVLMECSSEQDYVALLRSEGPAGFASIFDACVRDAVGRFAVDPDRIYVAGVSQTGFFAWQLAVWAPWRYAGVLPAMAVLNDARASITNCIDLPVYVLTGEKDVTVPPDQGRAAASTLMRLGSEVEYHEVEGGDHGAWMGNVGAGLRWLLERERGPLPRRFALAMNGPLPRFGAFLRVDELAGGKGPERPDSIPALLEAEVEGQTVRIESDDVLRFTLQLSDDLMDLDQPVTVIWNGEQVHRGPVERSLDVLLESLVERMDTARTFTAQIEVK